MKNAFKIFVMTSTLTLSASNANNSGYVNEPLLPDTLYACPWWPTCKDPEDRSPVPVPTAPSLPKPSDDKDTPKDKKDEARLA
ncbi:hypothetical protein [Arsukibacterium sp.]|uniref:hypothetical protein n=1 Tax=Arsukibacterium sp. TaxID=1977258 RepID=UPI00299E0E32|nr:hypothetical protein [Arsukibacterium sp.]MDX1676397.1 hypothetical protein [Arsukibacterium sp.]